jgi:hydroxyacylglutathione hydrolase
MIRLNAATKPQVCQLFTIALLLISSSARSQLSPASLNWHWNEGAENCKATYQPLIEVHKYNPETYILRENLCATFEAPFMYLLIGSTKTLLIDTGDVSDPREMPLAGTVMNLLAETGASKLPLLVVHTHRHGDHRAGDVQFASLPNVQVVGFDFDSVRRYFNFSDWPNGVSHLDLGDRTIEVIPTPGHSQTEISFYDRNAALFFSGDFLLPGRLLIEDDRAELASANRVVAFVKDRPVSYVLGGHIELDSDGEVFPWESHYHPHEHPLQMSKDDLLALPAAVSAFNGFYTRNGRFILINPMHDLIALTVLVGVVLVALVLGVIFYIRRRRRIRTRASSLVTELS